MSQAELEIGRTVIRTVELTFGRSEIEEIMIQHVRRKAGVQLKDFTLTACLGDGGCTVAGQARTEGLAPTRKRKARA